MKKSNETPEEKKYRENVETIAQEICNLSRQIKALLGGRLNRDTIIILLAYQTKISQRDVMAVLKAIEDMEDVHIKK